MLGRLLAAAVFLRPAHTAHSRTVSPPRPSQSLLIAQVTLPFCIITFLWFFLYPALFPRLHFVMLLIPLCFLFVNGFFLKISALTEEKRPSGLLEVLERLSVTRGTLS